MMRNLCLITLTFQSTYFASVQIYMYYKSYAYVYLPQSCEQATNLLAFLDWGYYIFFILKTYTVCSPGWKGC